MIIAIDPGTFESALVVILEDGVIDHFKKPNDKIQEILERGMGGWEQNNGEWSDPVIYIEQLKSYGMPIGDSVLKTAEWIGRFKQMCDDRGYEAVDVPRAAVKGHICHDSRAKDANVRQAIIDLYGGKEKAIGKKKTPGPLYGIKADCWQALALAIYAKDHKVKQ